MMIHLRQGGMPTEICSDCIRAVYEIVTIVEAHDHDTPQRPKCKTCGDYHFPSEPCRRDDDDDSGWRQRKPRPRPTSGAPARKLEVV